MPAAHPFHEANRLSWNAATRAHNSHKGDQAKVLREGGETIFPEELDLLGDLRGRQLLHLLCNSGQDTLSLATHGAEVHGVDISDEAIATARTLSRDSNIPARFDRADIFDWLPAARARGERFDVAFASYGALPWISDLDALATGVASILHPGGRFVLMEYHPAALVFDEDLRRTWPWSTHGEPLEQPSGVTDYVADSEHGLVPGGEAPVPRAQPFSNPHPCYEYLWSLSEVMGALLDAGFLIERFEEYPYSNGFRMFRNMKPLPGRRWTMPDGEPELPLMFGLVGRLSR